ncbi:MAG TPA: valine--tRNA ligase [Chiayiivirga sp.]|nr:valine--tRNA ligase [Chiayiivirga sp.]
MDKSFDPAHFETRWYDTWERSSAFTPSGTGTPYTILLPPPNVTGTLHMGHAFQHTLMDALIRHQRMKGRDTLWQVGTDHAGIATEMVVSRNLAREGKGETRDSLGREGFIEKVWEWKQESGDTIERQMRRMGTSGDWPRRVFTMDSMPSKSVIEAFVRLHEEGLIYRGQRLVNWDPVLKTAISDLEVVSEEEDGFLWEIRYPLADGARYEHVEHDADGNESLRETRDHLIVATTRPETLLGDVAVMVHPDDARYANLVGKRVELPLTGRRIPIIADDYVDRAFGTGVVKVTPAHDFNDYAVGQRHGLEMINLFTPDAALNDNAPDKYRGLDRYVARKAVLADLEAANLLVEAKPHKLQVPRGDRTGQVIEPYLTDQWFVKMETLGARGLELVESGAVKFVPPNWINTYRHWMENIQDWCISRQLWWGHRIPAWYDGNGHAYVGRDEAEVRAKHGLSADTPLSQDSDVLETWFSSALWPFSTQGWPDETTMAERGFDRYVPSNVLVTGFDIIFFWVARMVMMTDHFTDKVPFHEVYITGLVRDKDGQKMSKSKGNVLDPIDLIDGIALDALVEKRTAGLMQPKMAEKIAKATQKDYPSGIPAFGADALRFTFASLATHGRDIKFDLNRCEGYKNFCNKLWNAARFVLGTLPENTVLERPANWPELPFERALLARFDALLAEVDTQFAAYRFDLVSQAIYEFVWNEFCDWSIEFAKPWLAEDSATRDSVRFTLARVLEASLRLAHPLIPFITEEVWQHVAPRLGMDQGLLMAQSWPVSFAIGTSDADLADIDWLKAVIEKLRSVRSTLGIAPNRKVALLVEGGSAEDGARVQAFADALKALARIESIDALHGTAPAAASAVLGELRFLIPLEGLIDLDAERARLTKEVARVASEKEKSEAKLAKFGDKVPANVVEQERQRLSDWSTQLDALVEQQTRLG